MNINEAFPSKYLKAADIKGKPPIRVVIESMSMELMDEDKPNSYKLVIRFQGKKKGFACNKTNASMIAHTYGPETDNWVGKTIELRCEPVPFKGEIVDSIRVAVAQVATHTPDFGNSAAEYAADQVSDHGTMDQSVPDSDFDEDIPF